MQVKKIENAPFHNANKLNGRKSPARYGIFKDGVQVGFVLGGGGRLWEAYDLDCKSRILLYSCSTLSDLKKALAGK